MKNIIEQMAALASAGFTKTEIVALIQANNGSNTAPAPATAPTPAPTPAPTSAPATAPAPAPTSAPAPATAPAPAPTSAPAPATAPAEKSETEKLIEALGIKVDSLTQAMYGKNISSAGFTKPAETADDVIAHIINPNGGVIDG